MDNNFAFVHAVFHVVLFILIHGHRVQRRQPHRIPPATKQASKP